MAAHHVAVTLSGTRVIKIGEPVEFRVTVTVRDGWVVDIGEPMDLQADDGPSEMADAKQNPPETHRVAVTLRGTAISESIDIPD
jgi:hypothetical protein